MAVAVDDGVTDDGLAHFDVDGGVGANRILRPLGLPQDLEPSDRRLKQGSLASPQQNA